MPITRKSTLSKTESLIRLTSIYFHDFNDVLIFSCSNILHRVTSIDFVLLKLLRVVSTRDEINRVERFMQENGLNSSNLLRDLETAKYELQWAEKYVPVIKEAMKQNM